MGDQNVQKGSNKVMEVKMQQPFMSLAMDEGRVSNRNRNPRKRYVTRNRSAPIKLGRNYTDILFSEIADNTIENGQLHVLVKMNGMRRCVLCGGISSWRCQGCTNRVKKDGFVVLCNAEKC
eukprot:509506_1